MTDTGGARTADRREFTQVLTLMAAGGFGGAAVAADSPPPVPDAKALQEALRVLVRFRFGKLLSEAQLKRVETSVGRAATRRDAMKKVPLSNGDDPALAFRADLP